MTTSKNGLDCFFNAHQLGVRSNFDVDVKILLNFDVDSTNVKTAIHAECIPYMALITAQDGCCFQLRSTFCGWRELIRDGTL